MWQEGGRSLTRLCSYSWRVRSKQFLLFRSLSLSKQMDFRPDFQCFQLDCGHDPHLAGAGKALARVNLLEKDAPLAPSRPRPRCGAKACGRGGEHDPIGPCRTPVQTTSDFMPVQPAHQTTRNPVHTAPVVTRTRAKYFHKSIVTLLSEICLRCAPEPRDGATTAIICQAQPTESALRTYFLPAQWRL